MEDLEMKHIRAHVGRLGKTMARLRASQGFTLIELMIVIMIIALLAMLATPQFLKMKANGCVAEFDQVLEAVRVSQKMELHKSGRFVSAVGIEEMERNLKNFELDKPTQFFSYRVTATDNSFTLSGSAIEGSCPGLSPACTISWTQGDPDATRSDECP